MLISQSKLRFLPFSYSIADGLSNSIERMGLLLTFLTPVWSSERKLRGTCR